MAFKRFLAALTGLALAFSAASAQALPAHTAKWTAGEWTTNLGLSPVKTADSYFAAHVRPDGKPDCLIAYNAGGTKVDGPTGIPSHLVIVELPGTENKCPENIERVFVKGNSEYQGIATKLDQVSSELARKRATFKGESEVALTTTFKDIKILGLIVQTELGPSSAIIIE